MLFLIDIMIKKQYKCKVCNPPTMHFFMAHQSLVGWSVLIIKALWSHSDTPHSIGLLWTSDQPNAQTSTWQHTTLTRDRHPFSQWDSNPQSQQVSGHRPTTLDLAATGIAPPADISWLQPADTRVHSCVHPEWVNDLLSVLFVKAKQIGWTFNACNSYYWGDFTVWISGRALTECFHGFSQSLQVTAGTVHYMAYEQFLPNFFHSITC